MRRLSIIMLFLTSVMGWVSPVQAANIQSYIMESNHFYSLYPGQRSLSEQLAAIVNSPPNALDITQHRPVKVAILLFGSPAQPKNRSLLTSFDRRMEELRINYQLDVFFSKHNDYDAAEYNKLKRSQPDYLIVTHIDMVQSRYVERLLRERQTKVMFYGMSTPIVQWQNYSPFMYAGFDQVKAANTLASYLHRQLPKGAKIAAFVLASGYLGERRCDTFLDAMAREKRAFTLIRVMPDDEQRAYQDARELIEQHSVDFVFSCTQKISDGVVAAIKDSGAQLKTNSWGLSQDEEQNLLQQHVLVSSLFMWDDLAIAMAEGIKEDIEGDIAPRLYIARMLLASAALDAESLHLMIQQVFRYSVEGM